MNKIFITGNLTRDPETGATKDGVNWTRFSIAVRKRHVREGEQDAIFMRVTAWRQLGDNCAKYLAKGRKVAVSGSADVYAWLSQAGEPRALLEITADDVEFLSPKQASDVPAAPPPGDGYVEVDGEELDF